MARNVTRELALKVISMDFCGSICYLDVILTFGGLGDVRNSVVKCC